MSRTIFIRPCMKINKNTKKKIAGKKKVKIKTEMRQQSGGLWYMIER